jgi:sugar lactone lactonase YvrE
MALEINTIQGSPIACFMDGIQLLWSFGELQGQCVTRFLRSGTLITHHSAVPTSGNQASQPAWFSERKVL